ncbi:hypothetical protein SeLEV6574_g02084 [Synchytrium endobioticum]|nr:hypothetical protein SeLEV6574_g02084 [Synchytrium endobioticum]
MPAPCDRQAGATSSSRLKSSQKKKSKQSPEKPTISLLISTSGAASSLGFASFLQHLPSRPKFKVKVKSSSESSIASSHSNPAKPASLGARCTGRRAQSLYIPVDQTPAVRGNVECPPPHNSRRTGPRFLFRSTAVSASTDDEGASPRLSRDGGSNLYKQSMNGLKKRALTLGNAAERPPLAPPTISSDSTIHSLNNPTQPVSILINQRTNSRPRLPSPMSVSASDATFDNTTNVNAVSNGEPRVGSAPSTLAYKTPSPDALGDDQNQDHADDDNNDEMFISSTVQAKARDMRLREQSKLDANYAAESWDEDFDTDCDGGQPLQVPTAVRNSQETLRVDIANVRKFALHIQDLKLLHAESTQIMEKATVAHRSKVEQLNRTYGKDVEHALFLIDFAESADGDETSGASISPTDAQCRVLYDILGIHPSPTQQRHTHGMWSKRQGHPPPLSSDLGSTWTQQSFLVDNDGTGIGATFSYGASNNNNARTLSRTSSWGSLANVTFASPVIQPLTSISSTQAPTRNSIASNCCINARSLLQPSRSNHSIHLSPIRRRNSSSASSMWSIPAAAGGETSCTAGDSVRMLFSVEYMPRLLRALGEVKARMTDYLAELRDTAS